MGWSARSKKKDKNRDLELLVRLFSKHQADDDDLADQMTAWIARKDISMISTTLLASVLFPIALTSATPNSAPNDPPGPDNGDDPLCPPDDCKRNSVDPDSVLDSFFDGFVGWRPISCSVQAVHAPVFDAVNLTISFAHPWPTREAKIWLGFTGDGDTTWIPVAAPGYENGLYSTHLSLPLPMEAPFQAQLLSVDPLGRRTVSVCETQ